MMMLTPQQRYDLLAKHGMFAREICDKCGQILGPARFTRKDEKRVWCSRECRDGANAREPKTCGHCRARLPDGKRHGAVFCDDACRKAFQRQNGTLRTSARPKLSRTKPSIYAAFSLEKSHDGIPSLLGSIWRA
jgi:hypothetical protein